MNYVSIHIYQDVVIMPVFDVEEILNQTIPCQRLYKVSDSCFPIIAKDLFIDIPKTPLMWYFLEIADSSGIINKLNETTIWAVWYNGIGFHPYFNILFDEYLVDKCDQLHSHILLP